MVKVGLGLAITALLLGGAARARAEEPAPRDTSHPGTASPAVTLPAPAAPSPAAPSSAAPSVGAPVLSTPSAAVPAAPAPAAPAVAPCPSAVDLAAEQRAFERELVLFARRWEMTQRLVAEREARAFAEAEARYAKLAALTKKLAEEAALEAERNFDAAVALFVKKRELTQTLSAAPKAPSPAAPAPTAPPR